MAEVIDDTLLIVANNNPISDRKATYEVIKRISGQANILTIPRIYVDITGDVKSALFLSQCIYWADKMGRTFYKTYNEWQEEIGLSRWEIDNARKACEGIVITELKKANGAPTLHYTVDWEVLYIKIQEFAICEKTTNGFVRKPQMDLRETSKSLTEITTEITTDIIAPNFQKEQETPAKESEENVNKEEYIASLKNAVDKSYSSPLIDYAQYPERLRPIVERMEKLWYFKAPRPKKKSGQFAFWVESCNEILQGCAEFGVDLLDKLHDDWEAYMDVHGGCAPFTISSPKSLVNAVLAKAAMMRSGNLTPLWKTQNKENQSRLNI